jgi:hypothetical protein
MTLLYFAVGGRADLVPTFTLPGRQGCNHLVALQSLASFEEYRPEARPSRWALDSGAFIAHQAGKPVEYERWRDIAAVSDADEVFGLDVIGDAAATRANCERAWADGIEAIPTFHVGSPWAELEWAASEAPKIALGGVARLGSGRLAWLKECFGRVWPKRIHGFGITSPKILGALPFHSVDSSTWSYAARGFGRFVSTDRRLADVTQRGLPKAPRQKDLWGEVQAFQRLEKWASYVWRAQLAELADLPSSWKV